MLLKTIIIICWLGPAGLSAAIRLKQLAAKNGQEISVCVVEKGSSNISLYEQSLKSWLIIYNCYSQDLKSVLIF